MSPTSLSMSTRLRSQPLRLLHEQDDAHYNALETSALLQAIALSLQPRASDTSESSSGETDSEAEEEEEEEEVCGAEPVDEQDFIDIMDDQQHAAFTNSTDDDMKTGWQQRCSDSGQHQFAPGIQRLGCLLPDTVITPLDYFLQLVTPGTIDYFCERTNAYASAKEMKRRSDNKENEDPDATDSDSELEWEEVTANMEYMRGVDVYSQRESYSRIGRKTARWWPHLAWFMIDMAANNAYVLYQLRPTNRRLTAAQFREQLMVALVGNFTQRKKRGRPEKVHYRADAPHIPMKLAIPQVCIVCAEGRKRKMGQHKPRTREGCETCGSAVHFDCWKKHLKLESEEDE